MKTPRKSKTSKPKVPPAIPPEKWAKMTPRERLLAIARDVLAQLASRKQKKLRPTPGTYIESADVLDLRGLSAEEARAQLLAGHDCRACAVGAMWLSRVRLANNVTGADVFFRYPSVRDEIGHHESRLIETAFECRRLFVEDYLVRGECDAASAFGSRYLDPVPRLKAIMENIVAGRGVFNPARKARAAK